MWVLMLHRVLFMLPGIFISFKSLDSQVGLIIISL